MNFKHQPIPSFVDPSVSLPDVFDALFFKTDEAVVIKDLHGKYLAANPRAVEWLGRPIEKIIGHNDCDLFSKEDSEQIINQDREVLEAGECLATENTRSFGDKKTILSTLKIPMHDSSGNVSGIIVIARDISEQTFQLRQSVEALRQSEDRMRVLFEGIDDAIFVHDETGRILDCNQTACSRLEYTKGELLNLYTRDIDAPGFAEGFNTRLARQVETGRLHCEGIHLTKSGQEIFVDIVSSVIEFEGKQSVLAVVRDISDLKRAEAARRSLELQIQHAQKLESLGVLAGGIAHDFNNLLMGVLGNSDLALLQIPPDSPARQQLDGIQVSAKRAAELCQQLLAYSGKGHFVIQPTSLNDILREMGKLLDITLSKKVSLDYDLKEPLPAVDADITQIRQVIMNLITNAADAIGNNPGTITIYTDIAKFNHISLEQKNSKDALPDESYVILRVSDTGPGMEKAVQEKIFEPFFSTKQTGRGLGLSAVLGIVRGHKGAIKVESKVGAGTTITLLFPPSKLPATTLEINQPVSKWRANGIVLLADDEEVVRTVTASMLETIGFSVITAHDGHAAVEMFRKHQDELACVILDLSMPRLSGQETLCEIRKINKNVPVILSSGYSSQEISIESETKPPGFIQKPYQIETLRAKLQEAIDKNHK